MTTNSPKCPISAAFLARSVSSLLKREAPSVTENTSVSEALEILRRERTGGLIVMRGHELAGIFTERDCVLKVVATYCEGTAEEPVSNFMTKDPVTVAPDAPIAYALNLMSHGGFRNLPIASDGIVLGLISVKDVVDALVQEMVIDLEGV